MNKTFLMAMIFMLGLIVMTSANAENTQYFPKDKVNLWSSVTNVSDGTPITGATCNADVYFPNNSVWLNQVAMTELSAGIYINNSYQAPSTLGTYIYNINCSSGNDTGVTANTFLVAEAQHPDAIYKAIMFFIFGLLALWLSFILAEPLQHPLRVVTWVCMMTTITTGMASGIISPQHIQGFEYIFYALIVIEIILFIVDVIWFIRSNKTKK